MAIGIPLTASGIELAGGCGLCGSHFTTWSLKKTVKSAKHQTLPGVLGPATRGNPNVRFHFSYGPRSALGSNDSKGEDDSPSGNKRSEEGSTNDPASSSARNNEKKDSAKSAVARALAYKKAKEAAASTQKVKEEKSSAPEWPKETPKVEIVTGQSFRSMLQRNDAIPASDVSLRSSTTNPSSIPSTQGKDESTVSLDAFNKAQANKQQQGEMVAAISEKPLTAEVSASGSTSNSVPGGNLVEVEIVTRDGVIKKVVNPDKAYANVKECKRTGVSSLDFAGLGFGDKKQGGRQNIREDYQPPPPGVLPEVEIITKDADQEISENEEGKKLYKPKVSTWGLFPRPADISKAYGGGRTIRPGDALETEEERIAREAKTQKLLADYKRKMGLDVDPRVKADCEKLFKQGNSFMESGDLKRALGLFEEVMEKMVFQSELYGSAALQGAICLDSLARFSEAREVYEKLVSHPNGKIRKQAQKLLYGFRAMENLKVSTASKWDTTVYAKYFEAFADGYNNTYKASDDGSNENRLDQTLAYSLLLFFPILLVVGLALSKIQAREAPLTNLLRK